MRGSDALPVGRVAVSLDISGRESPMPRKKPDGTQKAAVSRALRGMFRAIENRPLPDRLRSVVDQMNPDDAPEEDQARTKRKGA